MRITKFQIVLYKKIIVSLFYKKIIFRVINLQQNQVTQRGSEMINRVLEDRREYSRTSKTNHIEIFH